MHFSQTLTVTFVGFNIGYTTAYKYANDDVTNNLEVSPYLSSTNHTGPTITTKQQLDSLACILLTIVVISFFALFITCLTCCIQSINKSPVPPKQLTPTAQPPRPSLPSAQHYYYISVV